LKRRESALALVAEPRLEANPRWFALQKKRLGSRYESYWYSTEKRRMEETSWLAPSGKLEEGESLDRPAKAQYRRGNARQFSRDVRKVFRELYPLLRFTSVND